MALAPIGLLYLASMGRMIYLQVDKEPIDSMHSVVSNIILPAARGSILDRNGQVLAEDVASWDLVIDHFLSDRSLTTKSELGKYSPREVEERIKILADGIGLPFTEMWSALMVNPSSWQTLRTGLGPVERESIARTLRMVPWSGMTLKQNYRRMYPNDRVLGHVIGLQGAEPEKNEDGSITTFPNSGLERGLDSVLAGTDGMRHSISVSGENGVNPALGMEEPVHGMSVRTTLDLELSTFAHSQLVEMAEKHEMEYCFAIVVDPKTGEVLSMQGIPDYDANDPVNSMELVVSPFDGKEGFDGWNYPGRWRIEPGSTMKPLNAAYALDQGFIQPDQWFENFNGSFLPPRRAERDRIKNSVGVPKVPMRAFEAIVHSSNVVFAQIAREIGREGMADLLDFYGYHSETYDLPGLSMGMKPRYVQPRSAFMKKRSPDGMAYIIPTMGYGQAFDVPPLDHVMALSAIANGGMLMEPTMDPESEPKGRRILTEASTQYVRDAMHGMVSLEKRTWIPRRDDLKFCGKSGTAMLRYGPFKEDYTSLFCAFGPYEDPEVLVLVVAFGTKYSGRLGPHHFGSQVCSEAASKILFHALESRGSLATKSSETLDFRASGASLQRDQ
ncbi:MAG: hypothetical protein COA70_03580 [Planctomycetota bacterium]|nr:MAG: hypothetical protein COA70_03580 [Planctomycetota bacterium]